MRILIVEDYEPTQAGIKGSLADDCPGRTISLFQARSFEEAMRTFDSAMENGGIDVIVLDGDIGGGHHGSELADYFLKNGYRGRMFAASGDAGSQQQLVQHGCSKAVEKGHVVSTLLKLLEAV